jgi:hypothetical protein
MSMMLFSLCVHALLRNFEQKLPGSRFGKRAHKNVVRSYADNITILATSSTDLHVIRSDTVLRESNVHA